MPNITISLDEDLLKSGRRYAEKHQTSMNALIRKLLQQTVNSQSKNWLDDSDKSCQYTIGIGWMAKLIPKVP